MANGLSGLLSDALSNPLFNTGIGLLAAGGPSLQPVSLGQGLAQGLQFATRAQQQALQNQIVRAQLSENARTQAARERLRGLLAGQEGGETLGLLADIAPDAFATFAKGLLGTMFPTPLTPLEQATLGKLNIDLGDKQAEAAGKRAGLEDMAISASAGLSALDMIAAIPGADVFLINPGLISTTRRLLSAPDPTGMLAKLPSQISGIPRDQLEIALNAAETVNKQRNALGFGLSGISQAGVAGLRAQLEALGEGAGLEVQRSVFQQALDRAKREAEKAGEPLGLGETEPSAPQSTAAISPQPGVPARTKGLKSQPELPANKVKTILVPGASGVPVPTVSVPSTGDISGAAQASGDFVLAQLEKLRGAIPTQRLQGLKNSVAPLAKRSSEQATTFAIKQLERLRDAGSITQQKFDEVIGGLKASNLPGRISGMIPPQAIRFLKQNARDPAVLQQFLAKYGVDPRAFLR